LNTRILFSRLPVLVATLSFSGVVFAQSSGAEPRPTSGGNTNVAGSVRTQPVQAAIPVVEESRPRIVTPIIDSRPAPIVPAPSAANRLDQALMTAMQSHLGAVYHYNRTGPESFDCSGFVWRAFQDVGLNFQRGPARSYWATMPAPPPGEQFKFGTLVFFGGLRHVGIVVDEKGFYHSARHGGVMYSPFNEYWLSRIDGFRRVPADSLLSLPTANTKPPRPVVATAIVDEK